MQLEIDRRDLDRPFIYRSIDYLYQAMRLDLGRAQEMHSDSGSRDVYNIITERLPATLLLFGTANLLIFFTSKVSGTYWLIEFISPQFPFIRAMSI